LFKLILLIGKGAKRTRRTAAPRQITFANGKIDRLFRPYSRYDTFFTCRAVIAAPPLLCGPIGSARNYSSAIARLCPAATSSAI
jgi:hypothetical protein